MIYTHALLSQLLTIDMCWNSHYKVNCNSSALAMELCLSCTNPMKCFHNFTPENLSRKLRFVFKQAPYQYDSHKMVTLIARFMGPTWGPSGADRTQVGPMWAPWTLLSGYIHVILPPLQDYRNMMISWHETHYVITYRNQNNCRIVCYNTSSHQ